MGTFLLANLVLGMWFTFWFVRSKKVLRPNLLNLRGGSAPPAPPVATGGVIRPRILNVHFNYSDHMWDAYEVLGLPAGSPLEEVEKAFRAGCQKTASGHEFLERARDAINKAQSK